MMVKLLMLFFIQVVGRMDEKEIWDKPGGRMYVHSVISFHQKEKITPEEALLPVLLSPGVRISTDFQHQH